MPLEVASVRSAGLVHRAPWSGGLSFEIECRSTPNARSSVRHEVVVHEDWSVSTPHDLEAERVARAFGGYSSCVELVDRTLPALRPAFDLVTRSWRPAPRRDKREQWRVPTSELVGCCSGRAFYTVRDTVEHLRTTTHLATKSSRPPWQVGPIIEALERVSRPELGPASPAARYVRESRGLDALWQSGIHPDDVPMLAAFASSVSEPLPISFFEGVAYSGSPQEWINDVLTYRPDADTAAWLAWQVPSLTNPREWGLWLGFGLSRRDFLLAVGEYIPAGYVLEAAAATGWSERTAARVVVGWAKADCRPTVGQFEQIARHALEDMTPARGLVDAALAEVRALGVHIERTELGVMLAITGNRPMVVAAVRHGARSAADLLEPQRQWP